MEVSVHPCSLGHVLIASEEFKIHAIELGSSVDECWINFGNRWGKDITILSSRVNVAVVDSVLTLIDNGFVDPRLIPVWYPLGTSFQRSVWEAIAKIQPGHTTTYRDLAKEIGRDSAFRAVGTACGMNPIAILVPCHRVLASDGGLGGYRWGEDIKRKLLQREGIVLKK